MQTWTFTCNIEETDPNDFVATFPDFPEAITGGSSWDETLDLAADALEETVLNYLSLGRRVPTPTPPADGAVMIDLDPLTAARASLANAMGSQNLSNTGLARRLGKTEGAVRRLVDGSRGVKIGTVLEAMRAIGLRASLTVEEASERTLRPGTRANSAPQAEPI